MTIKTIAGACVALAFSGAAQAETLSYDWTGAPTWGGVTYGIDATLEFESLYGTVPLFSVTVDFGSHTRTFDGTPHIASGGVDFSIYTFSADFVESYGPMVTWHGDTDEQYRANLEFDFTYYKATKDMDFSGRILLQEFEEDATTTYCYNPYALTAAGTVGGTSGGSVSCGVPEYFGAYGQYDPQLNFAYTATQPSPAAAAPTISAVPLPASGLLLISAFGLAGVSGLRRRKG